MSKPGDAEEEYFIRQDLEKKAALAAQVAEEQAAAARAEAQALHHMRCGKCGGQLVARPFRGVEIDVCEQCGAVLLDKGELEHLAGADKSGVIASILSTFHFR